MKYTDWQTIDYEVALKEQLLLFNKAIENKLAGIDVESQWIFCEHYPVLTLGKHGDKNNLLLSEVVLKEKGIKLFNIERGGDITFHGPGQLVCYPIIDLQQYGIGLKQYIHRLEEIIIRVIAHYGLAGERKDGATGVWVDVGGSNERKICAIGIKSSRYVTMHGLAFNVNTDMSYFKIINPCGFKSGNVTSLRAETGRTLSMDDIKTQIIAMSKLVF